MRVVTALVLVCELSLSLSERARVVLILKQSFTVYRRLDTITTMLVIISFNLSNLSNLSNL